jgi:glycosyltransferase involved in cell wall biosynthesis
MSTLALNMIAGPGDAQLLDRCLKSFDAKNIFDEIVIVDTTFSMDTSIWEVIRKYSNVHHEYQWITKRHPFGNFAGARNFALQNTTSDYVMWLDCDDLAPNNFKDDFPTIRQLFGKYDIFMMDYSISSNQLTKRERVFRRIPSLFWNLPSHEQLTVNYQIHPYAYIRNVQIIHAPIKSVQISIDRNYQIMKHEYENYYTNSIAFYYGRELLHRGDVDGVKILQQLLDEQSVNTALLAQCCLSLCQYFKNTDQLDKLITYSRVGISFNQNYADFFIHLAEDYERKNDLNKAIDFYKKAMACQFSGGGVCNVDAYTIIPAMRLTMIYKQQDNKEAALLLSKTALQYAKHDMRQELIDLRKQLARDILNHG